MSLAKRVTSQRDWFPYSQQLVIAYATCIHVPVMDVAPQAVDYIKLLLGVKSPKHPNGISIITILIHARDISVKYNIP